MFKWMRRPGSADGERPSTSNKLEIPRIEDIAKPSSADSSPIPSRPASRESSGNSSRAGTAKGSNSAQFERPCFEGNPRPSSADGSSRLPTAEKKPFLRTKPRAFKSADSSPNSSKGGSPKSPGPCSALSSATPSGHGSPAHSPKPPRPSKTATFKRWGSPFPQFSKGSTRSCSPDHTVVSLEDDSAFAPQRIPKKGLSWDRPSPEMLSMLKFSGGSNPTTKRVMQVTLCAANARAPLPESKARKFVFYKNTDKESLVEELQALKVAVADQAYHFQLHRAHLNSLRVEHSKLEEKIAARESIDGSNAPRTGGESRLVSKIAGMRMRIASLEDDITNHQEKIQNLKYRYQVCLTREVVIQRNMTAGDVWRLQKEQRNAKDQLAMLTKRNKEFLHYRDKILPDLQESLKRKMETIKADSNLMFGSESQLKFKELEKVAKRFADESYDHKRVADKAARRARNLEDDQRKMRAKLKQERERKRKTQQDVWALAYETCMLEKDYRHQAKLRKFNEAHKLAKAKKHQSKATKGKQGFS